MKSPHRHPTVVPDGGTVAETDADTDCDLPVPEEVREDASLREIWDDLTYREKECWVHGHTWYYDTCMDCGARDVPPDAARW